MLAMKHILALCIVFNATPIRSENHFHTLFKRQSGGDAPKITELDSWTLPRDYVKNGDDNKVRRFRLEAPQMTVDIMSLDLIVTSIHVPDQNNTMSDVILGFDDIKGYLENPSFSGAFVSLSPKEMQDEKKTPRNWHPTVLEDGIVFSILEAKTALLNAKFSLTEDELKVNIKGMVTKPTFLSLGLKNYFNLGGYDAGLSGIEGHVVQINANEISEKSGQTVKYIDLEGHDLDMRIPQSIEEVIYENALKYGRDFVVERSISEFDRFVGRVSHSDSRRFLEVYSNQPVLHYNLLEETNAEGKSKIKMEKNGGFEVKMATLFDSEDISTVNPGDIYTQTIIYKFGVDQF